MGLLSIILSLIMFLLDQLWNCLDRLGIAVDTKYVKYTCLSAST